MCQTDREEGQTDIRSRPPNKQISVREHNPKRIQRFLLDGRPIVKGSRPDIR